MIEFLNFTEQQRQSLIGTIDYTEGIPQNAVEKDWWVTLTLKALFTGKYSEHIIFKGGTSLSKCWKLIERFSEDIDIAISPDALGATYEKEPSKAFVKKLKRKGCEFTSNELKEDLEKQFEILGLPQGTVEIYAAEVNPKQPDTDPQTLYVRYRSLFGESPYIDPVVKIEVSIRYMREPSSSSSIQSLLSEFIRNDSYKEIPFEVRATEPHRTFLEKAFLLHEEFLQPDKKEIRSRRMSRHLYDLVKMIDAGIDKKALGDAELYQTLITHRKHYSMLKWMGDYKTLERDTISFILPDELRQAYADDYKSMLAEMIYRDAPTFEELMKSIKRLYATFTGKIPPLTIINVQPEFPPYKFHKNIDTAKLKTWNIPLDDTFSAFRLFNVSLTPTSAKDSLTLEIIVDNGVNKISHEFPLSKLYENPKLPDNLFFITEETNYIDIPIPKGTKRLSGNIKTALLVDFEMILACEWIM